MSAASDEEDRRQTERFMKNIESIATSFERMADTLENIRDDHRPPE